MNSRERCLAAIRGQAVDRVPVFPLLMFLPADRFGISYREFATNGHALAEAQLKIQDMFGVDAITACSDAFRISADLGGDMVFPDDKPPYLAKPLVRNKEDLQRLRKPDPAVPGTRMADRAIGTGELVRAVGKDCLVLGWVDMPFAEACSICGVSEFFMMLYDNPVLAHEILSFLTGVVISFCRVQLETGVPMIGAGDAAASLLSPALFREFALPYEQEVCAAVHNAGGLVKLHICGNTTNLLNDIGESGADLFNVDHQVDLSLALKVYGGKNKCLKGNLDPVTDMLRSTPEQCRKRSFDCLRLARGSRYILSAGCEVPAAVTDDVFRAFCETPSVHSGKAE